MQQPAGRRGGIKNPDGGLAGEGQSTNAQSGGVTSGFQLHR